MLENILQFIPSFKSSIHGEEFGFSMGFKQETSTGGRAGSDEHNHSSKEDSSYSEELVSERQHTGLESKSEGNELESARQHPGLESKSEGNEFGLMNKSKKKRNRRKLRKKIKNKETSLKIIGVNVAGLMSKLESFKKLLRDKDPSVFCLQETKLYQPNKIKTEEVKNFIMYELLRKNSKGGGLCIGVNKDLCPVWVAQGDDEVECLVVEIWVEDFPIRIITAYGPQLGDSSDRKQKFWNFLDNEVNNAFNCGSGVLIQMDSNSHLGKEVIENDVNDQNVNGRLFCEFLDRNPQLSLINSLPICEGKITRMRKTTRGVEMSILDVFVTCNQILPYIVKMSIDEKREYVLTNYNAIKSKGNVIESDHNNCELEINLFFSPLKQDREEIFEFRNQESQMLFKQLTSNTKEFSNCFNNNLDFEKQARNWRKLLDKYFHKSFKKVRISRKPSKKKSEISDLMDKRKNLKNKVVVDENDEEEILNIEEMIADKCLEANRKNVVDNFKGMERNDGNIHHQGIWKMKKKYFPKLKPTLPVAKKNLKGQLITNPEELKELYLNTFKYRLRHRPVQPEYEELLDMQEELFELRLELAKIQKTKPWTMMDLESALKQLKTGKYRDPEGLIREIFMEGVIGEDLKKSMLVLFNKVKTLGKLPFFM